jgi:hypothetical protein
MQTRPSPKSALALVVGGALLLAGGALYLTVSRSDAVSPLFQHVLTIQIIIALAVWFAAARVARRFTVGKLQKLPLSPGAVIWGSSRLALLLATVLLMIGWLAALILGLAVETAFVQAVVLLLIVTAFTGMEGGAFLNSILAIRHCRAHTPK